MKRILIALLVIVGLFGGSCYLVGSQLVIRGDHKLLTAMQEIHNGMTQEQVRTMMGHEPSVVEAENAPSWITDQTGPKSNGKFWFYYMGFPPRNLIIYFDEDDKVVFTSWAST